MTATIINCARGKTKRVAFKMVIAQIARSIIKRLKHQVDGQVDGRFNHFNQFDDANEWLTGAMNAHTGFND